MTSGDGDHGAQQPRTPINDQQSGDASVADLCYDSDDLLTSRRGLLPADRPRPANGHVVVANGEVEPPTRTSGLSIGSERSPATGTEEASVAGETERNDRLDAVGSAESAAVSVAPATVMVADDVQPSTTAGEPPPPAGDEAVGTPASVSAAVEQAPERDGGNTAGPGRRAEASPASPGHPDAPAAPETRSTAPDAHDAPVATAESPVSAALAAEPAAVESVAGPTEAAADAPSHVGPAAAVAGDGPVGAPDARDSETVWAATAALAPVKPEALAIDAPAATDGAAVHAHETAEFPAVAAGEASTPSADQPPLDDWSKLPVGEVIDVPLPTTEAQEPTGGAATAVALEAPPAAASQLLMDPIAVAAPDVPAIPPAEPPAPPLAAEPPPPPASPPPEDEEEDGKTMTIIEHLEELRQRLTRSAISIVLGAIAGWFIVPHVVNYLETSFKVLGGHFYAESILTPFALELKLAFLIGFVLASPVVFYQIWAFVAPGLTRRERHYALPFSFIGSGLFMAGAVTGILIVPLAIRFLNTFFAVLNLEQLVAIDKYIMFIALIAVIFGITFELPIFMVGFSLLGVVNSRFFIQKFKVAIFIMFGAAMVITPGADLVSPMVLGVFLVILYWLGIFLIKAIGR